MPAATSAAAADQCGGAVLGVLARAGEEVPMSQDELDWARWWGANGCAEDTHPHNLWHQSHMEGAAK